MDQFLQVIVDLFADLNGWLMAAAAAITVFKVAQYVTQYQGGEADEKAQAVKHIRNTIMMGGGGFFLLWFAGEVMTRMDVFKVMIK